MNNFVDSAKLFSSDIAGGIRETVDGVMHLRADISGSRNWTEAAKYVQGTVVDALVLGVTIANPRYWPVFLSTAFFASRPEAEDFALNVSLPTVSRLAVVAAAGVAASLLPTNLIAVPCAIASGLFTMARAVRAMRMHEFLLQQQKFVRNPNTGRGEFISHNLLPQNPNL